MKIVCWQTILMKYHTLFFLKSLKMSQNLSSAAVVIGKVIFYWWCESYELFYSIRLSLRKRSILGFTLGCVENNKYYDDFILCIMGKIIHAYCLPQFFVPLFFNISFQINIINMFQDQASFDAHKESTSYRTSRTYQVRKLLHYDFSRSDSCLGRHMRFYTYHSDEQWRLIRACAST